MTATPNYPPYMAAYGVMEKILAKIPDHDTPELFTQEFLRYKLGFSREGDRIFVGVAKRLGLIAPDNKPTALYLRIRDKKKAAAAFAEALKNGYPTLYAKNSAVHELDRAALAALVREITGLEDGAGILRALVGTFCVLKHLAYPELPVERVVGYRMTVEEKALARRKSVETFIVNRRKANQERRKT
jgi:hypothetical protein